MIDGTVVKKALLRIVLVIAVFVATVVITGNIVNLDSNDMTTQMSQPTYPIVTTEYYGNEINLMYGYTTPMELSYMRESITPLMTGRKMRLKVDTYGANVSGIVYELRTIDGSRLIEKNEIEEYVTVGRKISLEIVLKDLINNDQEYEFILILTLDSGESASYYTRIVNSEDYNVSDKLDYVKDFSSKTFSKLAAEDIRKYLEPKSYADNSSLGYVDIHSNFDQITWGDINPVRTGEPVVMIKEIDPNTGSFVLNYYVSTTEGTNIKYYSVSEFFRVRYTKERMYLLDYERIMDEVFVDSKEYYDPNNILLGISGSDTQMVESEDGANVAFVTGGRLYEYSMTDNKVAYLFGFYDRYTDDLRMTNRNHNIKIMNVDEAGNVTFLVYGYMNRGNHEGESGACAYYYDAKVNTIEELLYIPGKYSPDLLMRKIEELSYMSTNGILYLMAGESLYAIDSVSRKADTLAEDLPEGGFVISPNNHLVAWQQGDGNLSNSLILMNLETGVKKDIRAGYNEIVKPISFIGEDLIYGIAKKDDIIKDKAGNRLTLMNRVKIENEIDGVLMEYKQEDKYIISGEVNGNQIILHRFAKTEDGFEETTDDQIVNSQDTTITKNNITTRESDIYKNQKQITFPKEINVATIRHLTPKMVLFEGDRAVEIDDSNAKSQYVVYGKYGADSLFVSAGSAVSRAYEISGTVLDSGGRYIWRKTTRNAKNQIMAIKASESSETRSSVAVCMDTMLEYEGVVRNSQYMLEHGKNVIDILEDAFPEYEVLDLSGCSVDMILYYTNKDIPVLVMLEEEKSVLLIGYNDKEVVIMNPEMNDIYKVSVEEAVEWFEENSNCFITYIPDVE